MNQSPRLKTVTKALQAKIQMTDCSLNYDMRAADLLQRLRMHLCCTDLDGKRHGPLLCNKAHTTNKNDLYDGQH